VDKPVQPKIVWRLIRSVVPFFELLPMEWPRVQASSAPVAVPGSKG